MYHCHRSRSGSRRRSRIRISSRRRHSRRSSRSSISSRRRTNDVNIQSRSKSSSIACHQ